MTSTSGRSGYTRRRLLQRSQIDMSRLLDRFVLAVTAILGVAYLYVAWRLTVTPIARVLLAVPFLLVWIVPVVYWGGAKDRHGRIDHAVHYASYVSMGWLSFLLILTLARDALLLGARTLHAFTDFPVSSADPGVSLVLAGSFAALGAGMIAAYRGPHIRHVDIPVDGLPPALHEFRIVQISDLHVGLTIRGRYVQRVVDMTKALAPDLIALTGDMVDGSVAQLARDVQALAELPAAAPTYCVLGNHEYYSGAAPWIAHFRAMGLTVLMNTRVMMNRDGARLMVAGVTDPAALYHDPQRPPRPDLAAGHEAADFRLLLAHHPKLAPAAREARFDLQLSGHTHAGQFFPWTLAVRLVHAPHVAGLSREGRMWVYVSAGTGTWGPPVRFGTRPELTVLRLVHAD